MRGSESESFMVVVVILPFQYVSQYALLVGRLVTF